MMSSPKATSSMCGDPNQVRYQKALKEITKLINYNNELKQELGSNQEQLTDFNEKLAYKDSRIEEILQEKQQLESQMNDLTKKYIELEEENIKLKTQNIEIKGKVQRTSQTMSQSKNIDVGRPFSKQNNGQNGISNIYQQQRKIQDLERNLSQKNDQVKELYSNNNDLRYKLGQFQNSPTYLRNNNENIPLVIDKVRKNISDHDLQRKLRITEQWNNELSTECAQLKSKLLKYENNSQALLHVRSEKYMKSYSPLGSPRQGHSKNSTELLKEYKKIQKEVRKLHKVLINNQSELNKFRSQNTKAYNENKVLHVKIQGYEKIIQKQEKEMQEMMKEYEKQLQNYSEDFKEKLEEQRKNFSPSKNAKALKQLEILQAENKSLKKKFQLCSIQLTKCFKALEVYKLKMSQNEREYNELAKDREQILQKLSKLQGSNQRQKSIGSKNSLGKPQGMNFGNSSIIEDI